MQEGASLSFSSLAWNECLTEEERLGRARVVGDEPAASRLKNEFEASSAVS